MKYLLTFLLCALLTFAGLFTVPSIQNKITERLLNYFEESFGIEVAGGAQWTLFPFALHLNQVSFDTLHADRVDIGIASVSIKALSGPDLTKGIDAKGSWWFDFDLRPLGSLEAHHPDWGDLKFAFFFQKEQKKRELCLCLSATGDFGHFQTEGALPIPKIGLKTTLEEGRSLFARFKMHWGHEQLGSMLGYMTVGWENGEITFPSLEMAGSVLDVPFTVEGNGDLQASKLELSFVPLEGPLTEPKITLQLYHNRNGWFGNSHLTALFDGRSLQAEGELTCHEQKAFFLKNWAVAFDGHSALFDAMWDMHKKEWAFKGDCTELTLLNEKIKHLTVNTGGIVGELVPLKIEMVHGENPLNIEGQISLFWDGAHLFLHKLEGSFRDLPLSFEETVCLSVFKKGWNLDRLFLKAGATALKLNGHGFEDKAIYKGDITGIDGCGIDSPIFPLSGQFSLEVKASEAKMDGIFKGANQESIETTGVISLVDQSIDGKIKFKGELSPYLSMILPDTTSISGNGEGNFIVTGSLEKPHFEGKLSLRKGIYEDLITGMLYREMECDFILNDDHIDLFGLSALDNGGGKIVGEGELKIQQDIPFVLYLESKRGELIHLDYALARASGKVRLSGNRDGGIFEGELKVDESSIRLPEKTPLLFQKLDIVYEKIKPEEEKSPWKLAWDLNLDFQSGVKASSGIFKSEWRGNASLQGTTDAPLLFGKGALVNANFNFNGKHFESTDGVILFQGEPGSKTTFYITAKQEIEDLKVEIILKGPLKSPEIAFRSNPPKPTKEIISYLLLNRGTGSDETTPLAESAIKLDTANTEASLLDKFKSTIGIDRIEISGEEDEALSLEVGKYILPSLYFCLKKSVTDGPNQAAVVAKFPHHFKAQGEVGDNAEGNFMLKWERDY